uniref:Transmembrane protein 214 n=4 Tax=Clastoptera arizonana TaxID=38151 RepID=A0A1B6C1J5_9HEMI
MSGQWELVSKTKRDKHSGSKKISKAEKQKFVDNAPKIEDLLPLSQVKTLYEALDNNKQNSHKIPEKVVKTKENEIKKIQKKHPEKKKEGIVKEKSPKTLEAAVNLLAVSDFKNLIEEYQLRFPEAPLVWLKGLSGYINTKLAVDFNENSFTPKSFEYPLCLLPVEIKNDIKKALKEVPEAVVQMFFDYCLTSMAVDLTKGSPVSGYKVLLQLIAVYNPSVTVSNISKYTTLRNSYQNRQAIGTSILWALGQGGFKDVSVGLKVWQELMMPLCELRNYTRFVLDYLKHLLGRHSSSKALTTEQYFSLLDTIFGAHNLSNVLNTELKSHAKSLSRIVCNVLTENRLHNMFEPLMLKLKSASSHSLKEELASFLCVCLSKDQQSYSLWRQLYTKHLPESATLLRHINSEWKGMSDQLSKKHFKNMLNTFKVTNNEMARLKQKTEGLQECNRLCEVLLSKMITNKTFPWVKLSFVLILVISGLLAFDVNKYGSFKDSSTGHFLQDIGALTYFEHAYTRVQIFSIMIFKWCLKNIPVYYGIVKETTAPVLAVVKDMIALCIGHFFRVINILAEYTAEKVPVVIDILNAYAPGLFETVQNYSFETWSFLSTYLMQLFHLIIQYIIIVIEWTKVNIFVGKLSPENLQKYTMDAIETTHNVATQTFAWLSQQTEQISI